MAETEPIPWQLSKENEDLPLARNVGGVFKLHNDGPGMIQHSKGGVAANNVPPKHTVLVEIAPGADLVIRLVSPPNAKGTFQLISR